MPDYFDTNNEQNYSSKTARMFANVYNGFGGGRFSRDSRYIAHEAAKGIKIDSIESTLEGDIDLHGLLQLDDTNPGYQGINISFKIESDASDETLEDLICLAKRASPVANTIARATSINPRLVK